MNSYNINYSIIIFSLTSIMILLLACKRGIEYNSFHPGEIWEDDSGIHINAHGGGILYHEGMYYWYGQHMIEGEAGNKAQVGIHCYSSTDLYNWKDQGITLKVVENNPDHDITKGCILERPKVIFNKKTEKFVMWFHIELIGQASR